MSRTDDHMVGQVGDYVPDPPADPHKFQGGQYMGDEEVCSECIGVEDAPQHVLPEIVDHPHRWSGWPGAICQDCFIEDQRELCLADVHRPKEFQRPLTGEDARMLGDHMCVNPPCPAPNPGFPSDPQNQITDLQSDEP